MTGGLLLGLDFGTGGAKATIIDDEGGTLAYAFSEYPLLHRNPGWSEHDPDLYWKIACDLIRQVLRDSGSKPSDVAGLGISSALPSMVLVDNAFRPLAPALNLLDRRAVNELQTILDTVGAERIQRLTANRIEDHPNIVNLYWFQRHQPDLYRRVHKALTIDGFIAARLTGRATVNMTSAVFFGVAYDIRKQRFDQDILHALGIDPGLLPQIVEPTAVIGEVGVVAADESGLVAGTPVVGGQVDCNAGWIAGGAIAPGDVQLNLGTSGVIGVVHRDESFLSSAAGEVMINVPYTTGPTDTYAAVAATTTGGQALRYVRDLFGPTQMRGTTGLTENPYDLLTNEAEQVPPCSDGLIVLPYLMGERSPLWDGSARAVMFGLSLHHGRGHVVRAFLEGVAFAMYDSFRVLQGEGLQMNLPLVFNEGGARSATWRRIITDVFGIPTVMLDSRVGAPRGDAILAGVGIGMFPDFSIAAQTATFSEPMEPSQAAHGQYLEHFELFRSIYQNLTGNFQELRRLTSHNHETTLEG